MCPVLKVHKGASCAPRDSPEPPYTPKLSGVSTPGERGYGTLTPRDHDTYGGVSSAGGGGGGIFQGGQSPGKDRMADILGLLESVGGKA